MLAVGILKQENSVSDLDTFTQIKVFKTKQEPLLSSGFASF